MDTDAEMVECSLCSKQVPIYEVCSTLACRACHKSITLEDCKAGTTSDELAWKARVAAAVAAEMWNRA